jgi:hypothetical protein
MEKHETSELGHNQTSVARILAGEQNPKSSWLITIGLRRLLYVQQSINVTSLGSKHFKPKCSYPQKQPFLASGGNILLV